MWHKVVNSRFGGLLVALFISVLVYNKWFFSTSIFGWGDWGYLFSETVKEWATLPSAWIEAGLGYIDIGLSMYVPVRLFYGLLAHLMDFNYFDRLVFLFPSVVVPAIGSFLLVKKVTKNNFAALVGSFVYTFNTYMILLNTGHFTLSVAFGVGIFVFLLYQKTLETKKYFWAVLTGLVAFLEFSYEARAFYLTSWILLLYFVYSLLIQQRFQIRSIARNLLFSIIPLVITVLLSSFWLISLFINSSSFNGIVAGRQLYGEGHFQILRAMTMFHPFWSGNHNLIWGDPQKILWWFWIIPFIAFSGYWFSKKDKQASFWAIITLLGIFLTKFTSQPFTGIYLWLYQYLPGFNAFRESSKFNYYIDLGYAVLIGLFVSFIIKSKISKFIKLILVMGISSLFLINTGSVFTGELARLLTPRHIPQDYIVLKNFLQKQPNFFRTLYFPRISRWGYWDSNHPNVGVLELVISDWKDLNNYKKTGLEYSDFEELAEIFKKDFSPELINKASIKYIIVPLLDLENEEMFIYYSDISREKTIEFLDKQYFLRKIDIGTKELIVYENDYYRTRIYLDNKTDVTVSKISSTQFDLTFNSKDKNAKLFFSEAYHPGWKIRIGGFSWWKSLIEKNYYLNDQYHIRDKYGLNQFDVTEVSDDLKMTLYFAPQTWVNVGSIISFSTLVVSLSWLLILWRKKHE